MKHLERFNIFESITTKSFFKDKINWKLVNYFEYLVQGLEDENYRTNIAVATKDINRYHHYNQVWASLSNGYTEFYDENIASTIIASYNNYGLYFIIRVQKEGDKGLDFRLGEKLYQKLKLKFDIEPDNTEEYFKLRYWKMPIK